MMRTLAKLAIHVALIAQLLGFDAIAEDLEGFPLGTWNKTVCAPQQVRSGSTLGITLPAGRIFRELSILAPAGRFYSVIDTPASEGMAYTSDQLKPGHVFKIDVARVRGYYDAGPELVFVKPGTYTIVVGRQFETDAPSVSAWCRVEYRAP
jgi:hypothetical protein